MARGPGRRSVDRMNENHLDCQVLVVGAGPTGLVLAAELLARGIRTRIIDQGDGAALQSRAIGVHARTLEVLDMMGLAEQFIERGQVVRELRWYSEGKHLVSLEFARSGSRFGMLLDLPQDETERLLRARIAELGSVVENQTELTGLTAGPDGVIAAASVLADPVLRPYRGDLDVVSAGATPVLLIRPDGHVAARGSPGRLEQVASYLHDLFGEPADYPQPADAPPARPPQAARPVSRLALRR